MRTPTVVTTFITAAALFALPGYSSCDPVIQNNGFDLWCGDQLCYWDVEAGAVRRAPTWHDRDLGVELVGDAVAISQYSDATGVQLTCLRFEMVADVDDTAHVTLEMDFYDDGIVDFERIIPTSRWAPVSYLVTMPRDFDGVRFRLRKLGSGHAVLAQLRARQADKCVDPPLELPPRPDGASCLADRDCVSGVCADNVGWLVEGSVCGECVGDGDCDDGEVCGAVAPGDPVLHMYRACVPAATRELGERCAGAGECATGVCCNEICSTCCPGPTAVACDAERICGRLEFAEDDPLFWGDRPWQCDPQQGLGAAGEWCLGDADCTSGTCTGTGELHVCQIDGRVCDDDQDCPGGLACVAVGSAGGACQ